MSNPRDPRDPRSGRGPGSTPGTPSVRGTPVSPGQRPPSVASWPPSSPSSPARVPSADPRYAPQHRQTPARPQIDDPEPLDLDALEPETLPPEALDPEALMALDPDALFEEALASVDSLEGGDVATDHGTPAIDPQALSPIEEEQPRDDPPLLEGFENTRLDSEFDRRTKKKPTDGPRRRRPNVEFNYTTCPGCNVALTQPAPPYCEACGTRLRKPGKKDNNIETKRCGECGFRTRADKTFCSNCGNRLPQEAS